MVLIIDNFDSFTHNIIHYCNELGYETKIFTNNQISVEEIEDLKPKKIIISPGASNPQNAGNSVDIVKNFYKITPILGICLGHQVIAYSFGAKIVRAKNIMHGKISTIIHKNSTLFYNIPTTFKAVRYNSLVIDKNSIDKNLIITSYSKDEEIMSIELRDYPLFGVQFHPESIMSEYGHRLIGNFLKI